MGHVCTDRPRACIVIGGARRRWAAVGFGVLLSAFFLWLALRQVDATSLRSSIASIRFSAVLMCAIALALGIALRGVRWRVISGSPRSAQRNFTSATNIGVLANLLLPGRAGEVVRVVTLARMAQTTLPGPLASALIDRLVDVTVLLSVASFLYWLLPIGAVLGKWLFALLAVGALTALLVVAYARSSGTGEVLVSRFVTRWLARWQLRPEVFLAELRLEFRRLLGGWLSFEVAILAALVLCADYGALVALLWAFDLKLAIEAPLLLWVFLAAGSALPSAPGYVGTYQIAAVWSLSTYAVPAASAVAVATVLQVATLLVALLMAGPGAWAVLARNSKMDGRSP